MARSTLSALLLVLSLACSPATAGDFQSDLEARRSRIMAKLGPEAMLILWSAPVQTYSHDIEYEYRQDSNLYYLTGIEQEETVLVLMPGNKMRKAILFIENRDPRREHWHGHMLSEQEATELSGIETVHQVDDLDAFLNGIFSMSRQNSEEYDVFLSALKQGKARLAVLGDLKSRRDGPPPRRLELAQRLKKRFSGVSIQDATEILHASRQVKTAYERKLLEHSAEIATEGHLAGMRVARAGLYEYEVEAAIEAEYKRLGAYGPSYPSIVASGPNANTLHYSKSTRRMEPGDLLLVDSGANYQYQTVDITRTYPVDGRFGPLQKQIYRIVRSAQDAGIRQARAGVTLDDIHLASVEVVKRGLLGLGLITDSSSDQYKTWYTHGTCHWIGMDVHDVGIRKRALEPGMAFVIEPGLYMREVALEILAKTPENQEFIETVRPAFEKYKDIGVRVEDSFLLTETGLKRLSARVPRTIREIEDYMASRPSAKDSAR